MGQPLVIPVAHDFTCPWCWVGMLQVKRLKAEFGVAIEWRGHVLYPEDMEWPESRPTPPIPNRPPTLSRLDFIKLLDGVEVPKTERPKRMRIHAALEAVEFIKEQAPESVDAFVEDMYRAYWERGERISDLDVILRLAAPYTSHAEQLTKALEERTYKDSVVNFDAPSYKAGVFNVPTFWIGDERYAEQPYEVLKEAMQRLQPGDETGHIYRELTFPEGPKDRPYVFINMVATIDGKILSGGRDEPVVDLGSKLDHQLMKRIESASDAVLIGAQTLRAAKKSWNPQVETRIVVTRSGDFDLDGCFFSGKPIIATNGEIEPPNGIEVLPFTDLPNLLTTLKQRGIERLLVMGGSSLNAQFFGMEMVDEIFITIAPKIKLGEDVPTIADGEPLPRESIQNYSVIERHQAGDELFVRYRRKA